jgi:hypothetical protein
MGTRAAVEPLESRLLLASGVPDPNFSGDGTVELNFGGRRSRTCGCNRTARSWAIGSSPEGPTLARFLSDGTIDSTYGAGGVVSGLDAGGFVRVLSDGKIMAVSNGVGENEFGAGNGWVFKRFNIDGSPDLTFDTDGVAFFAPLLATPADLSPSLSDVLVAPDDTVIAVGTFEVTSEFQVSQPPLATVARLLPDGTFDYSIPRPEDPYNVLDPTDAELDAAGRIFITGLASIYTRFPDPFDPPPQVQVVTLLPNGQPDESGLLPLGDGDVARLSDGSLVVLDRLTDTLQKYRSNFELDSDFGARSNRRSGGRSWRRCTQSSHSWTCRWSTSRPG